MNIDQINAGLRYAGVAGAGVFTTLATIGFVPQDQVAAFTDALHHVTNGLQETIGGLAKLAVILGPIAAVWLGKIGVSSASLTNYLTKVASAEKDGTVKIEGKIFAPPAIADAVPSDKVVGHP